MAYCSRNNADKLVPCIREVSLSPRDNFTEKYRIIWKEKDRRSSDLAAQVQIEPGKVMICQGCEYRLTKTYGQQESERQTPIPFSSC